MPAKKNTREAAFVEELRAAESLIHTGDLQSAADKLTQLGRMRPNDPRPFLLGSLMALASGNAKGRLDAALRAATLAPLWPAAALVVAQAYLEREARHEASIWVRRAFKLAEDQNSLTVEFLEKAAFVAQGSAFPDLALTWLDMALVLAPGDSPLLYKKARVLIAAKQFEDAVDVLTSLLASAPDNLVLLEARMEALRHCGRTEQLLVDANQGLALAPNNTSFQFYQTIALGGTPDAIAPGMVTELFDIRAHNFDKHLVVSLKYKLPRDVAALIEEWYPYKTCDILDVGCGTGLLGACLGPWGGVLVGVDLSQEMVKVAAEHRVYDKFHLVDAGVALSSTPEKQYDIIAALELFVYIGKLSAIFKDTARVLNPGGRFVFSCELNVTDGNEFTLNDSKRFSHSTQYVESCLLEAGLKIDLIEHRELRMELGLPVKGIFAVASRPL